MGTAKKLVLTFPKKEVEKPILYHLAKDFDLRINIFRARITPEEEGIIVLEVSGDEEKIKESVDFIQQYDIQVNFSGKALTRDEEKCVHCGNCLAHCPTGALHLVNPATREVGFKDTLCIECLNCVGNCPFKACYSMY